jgi:hypothetical protein
MIPLPAFDTVCVGKDMAGQHADIAVKTFAGRIAFMGTRAAGTRGRSAQDFVWE